MRRPFNLTIMPFPLWQHFFIFFSLLFTDQPITAVKEMLATFKSTLLTNTECSMYFVQYFVQYVHIGVLLMCFYHRGQGLPLHHLHHFWMHSRVSYPLCSFLTQGYSSLMYSEDSLWALTVLYNWRGLGEWRIVLKVMEDKRRVTTVKQKDFFFLYIWHRSRPVHCKKMLYVWH